MLDRTLHFAARFTPLHLTVATLYAAMSTSSPAMAAGSVETKPISNWVACDGTSDETVGVTRAFAAARNGAFTLNVDCPVKLKIGSDVMHSIFIEDGTTVEFTGNGKFIVDNVEIPAFVIADSSHITLTNWNVEYEASLPVNPAANYEYNGQFREGKAGNAFNDLRLTSWLSAHRAIDFDRTYGSVNSLWTGTTNACAVFFITGDSSYVSVTGMHLYVPANAGGNRFIPVAFTLGFNYKAHQTVSARTPMTGQFVAIPSHITFSNVTLDGTYMGWVGGVRESIFENITSLRYGDLEDASGGNVGGLDKWFAPPHLFYFRYNVAGDPALFNSDIHFTHVVDKGIRVGKARDLGGTDSISGYANSLKLGCVNCSVDGYQSARPDGLMDVLTSDGLTISNVTATYNSSFTNNLYPGVRFPSPIYANLKIEQLSLTDTATTTFAGPVGNANNSENRGIVLSAVRIGMKRWALPIRPFPAITGEGTDVSLRYSINADLSEHIKEQTGGLVVDLRAAPTTLRVGQSTDLTWVTWEASSCAGSGALSGATGTNGSRLVKATSVGTQHFTIECRNSSGTRSATVAVVVTP